VSSYFLFLHLTADILFVPFLSFGLAAFVSPELSCRTWVMCFAFSTVYTFLRLFYAACHYEGRTSHCSSVFLPVRTMASKRGGMPVSVRKKVITKEDVVRKYRWQTCTRTTELLTEYFYCVNRTMDKIYQIF
jgi:hypothetical protein